MVQFSIFTTNPSTLRKLRQQQELLMMRDKIYSDMIESTYYIFLLVCIMRTRYEIRY